MNLFGVLIVVLTLAHAASAAPPEVVRFHGAIGQLGGQPVQDGNYVFLAEIFPEATGGTAVYTQSVTAAVSAGAYTVVLSPTTPGELNAAFAESPRFLQITVVSGPGGSINQTLLPRQEIASVPYAVSSVGVEARVGEIESLMAGHLNGRVETLDGDELQLVPYNLDRLIVGIDGNLLSQTGPLLFKLPDHLDTGSPAPNTFYYLYVRDAGNGVMQPLISATPPVDRALPGMAATRYAGEFYTDAGTQIVPMEHNPLTGQYHFDVVPWPGFSLPIDEQTTFVGDISLQGYVPKTARAVLLDGRASGDNASYHFASLASVGKPASVWSTPPSGAALIPGSNDNDVNTDTSVFWVSIDGNVANPSISRAVEHGSGSDDRITVATLTVLGWRSLR